MFCSPQNSSAAIIRTTKRFRLLSQVLATNMPGEAVDPPYLLPLGVAHLVIGPFAKGAK